MKSKEMENEKRGELIIYVCRVEYSGKNACIMKLYLFIYLFLWAEVQMISPVDVKMIWSTYLNFHLYK